MIHQIAEILEVESLSGSEVLKSIPAWDSLAQISIIAVVADANGVRLTAKDLSQCATVNDLLQLIDTKSKS